MVDEVPPLEGGVEANALSIVFLGEATHPLIMFLEHADHLANLPQDVEVVFCCSAARVDFRST